MAAFSRGHWFGQCLCLQGFAGHLTEQQTHHQACIHTPVFEVTFAVSGDVNFQPSLEGPAGSKASHEPQGPVCGGTSSLWVMNADPSIHACWCWTSNILRFGSNMCTNAHQHLSNLLVCQLANENLLGFIECGKYMSLQKGAPDTTQQTRPDSFDRWAIPFFWRMHGWSNCLETASYS